MLKSMSTEDTESTEKGLTSKGERQSQSNPQITQIFTDENLQLSVLI
ncbi:hypothetical protein PLCT1_00612 [Planctomycetaceae bacterium]|nr:hypothetical protein PLCT1_00612 [Planctomycetaceae bacterium]